MQQRKRKISTLFDSGALITSAKFRVRGELIIDYVVDCCRVNIPPEVKYETIDMGLLFGYHDAQDLANRLDMGKFLVLNAAVRDSALESTLTNLGLENADCAVVHTYKHMSNQTKLITDDHRLFIATTRYQQVRRLHSQYLIGDITFRRMAKELGLEYRQLYALLEELNLPLA